MANIKENLSHVRQRIQHATDQAGRSDEKITLVAVSKRKTIELIEQAFDAGQRDFGENYLQEATDKILLFDKSGIVWHFIGSIQSNKTRAIAEQFTWVHTIDRIKIAQRLSYQRPHHLGPLNLCLQVNIDAEASKSGIEEDDVLSLAQQVNTLPNIRLRGLMAIPRKSETDSSAFQKMHALYLQLQDSGEFTHWDTLSMGMSTDLETAIVHGATMVRIGTDIFGLRE